MLAVAKKRNVYMQVLLLSMRCEVVPGLPPLASRGGGGCCRRGVRDMLSTGCPRYPAGISFPAAIWLKALQLHYISFEYFSLPTPGEESRKALCLWLAVPSRTHGRSVGIQSHLRLAEY